MGIFDTVRCIYPLPHHQDSVFQTKDMECIVGGVRGLGGTMSEYEITMDGRLRRRVHERAWREDPEYPITGGYFESIDDWWEDVEDAHGDVVIYTGGAGAAWVEFRVRFTNGSVQGVVETEQPRRG